MNTDELLALATEFTIYPKNIRADDADYYHWSLKVAQRSAGRWAVLDGSSCLGDDGTWVSEGLPSGRDEEYLAHHRFDQETAIQLALDWVDKRRINGRTYDEWQTHWVEMGVVVDV